MSRRIKIEMGKPKIVASITSHKQISEAERSGADLIEIRLDLFKSINPAEIKSSLPIIATNRSKKEGGAYRGTEKERTDLLLSLLDRVNAVDIELNCKHRDNIISEAKKKGITAIISYHNFQKTPPISKLRKILKEELSTGDLAKVAVMASSLEDVIQMLKLSLELKGEPVCIIAMGSPGRQFRAIAPVYGSILAYGSIGKKTAPGQLTVKELCEIRRLLW